MHYNALILTECDLLLLRLEGVLFVTVPLRIYVAYVQHNHKLQWGLEGRDDWFVTEVIYEQCVYNAIHICVGSPFTELTLRRALCGTNIQILTVWRECPQMHHVYTCIQTLDFRFFLIFDWLIFFVNGIHTNSYCLGGVPTNWSQKLAFSAAIICTKVGYSLRMEGRYWI